MSAAIITRIRKSLQAELDEIYGGFEADHSLSDVADAVEIVLRTRPDVLPNLRDVSYMVAEKEDHRRCSMPIPKQMDVLTPEWAQAAEIRLRDGRRVSYANATNRQLRRKQSEQIQGIKRDTEAAAIVAELIDLMDEYPDAHTLTDAMIMSGRWSLGKPDRDPPDLHPV